MRTGLARLDTVALDEDGWGIVSPSPLQGLGGVA